MAPGEFLQWGEVMQKAMKVDLKPYRDFHDLLERGTPDYWAVQQIDRKLTETEHGRELKQAIYGKNAAPGDDDDMNSTSKGGFRPSNG